jgi:hypothetical protein
MKSKVIGRGVQLCLLMFMLANVIGVAAAGTYTIAAGSGTLTYTETTTTTQCFAIINGRTIYYTQYRYGYTGFSYTLSGVTTPLTGSDAAYYSNGSSQSDCETISDPVWLTSASVDVHFVPRSPTGGSVDQFGYPGYVNPKYMILGVTYAPPGPSSFVNYLSSTLVANETDLNSSFSSGYAVSISVKAGIDGWLNGSVTGTSSTSYTQESNTSSSVTVSKQTSVSDQTPGPANPYSGLNHDYDVIWLWLNPVSLMTVYENTTGSVLNLQLNGFGYSTADQPNMDVYPVYVGWLNGDISIPSNVQQVLNRTWAASETWPSGQGPALSSTDFQTIEASDPYWQCTPKPTSCPTTVDGTRFTGPITGKDFIYQQAPVGGNPTTQTYTDTYMNTTTQGQGATYKFAQTFGLEETFGGKAFGIGLTTTLQQSSTLTWTSQWNNKITSTNTSTGGLSITGAPCVVSGTVCNPVYTGPTEFDVYEDNLYGTFLFYPIN